MIFFVYYLGALALAGAELFRPARAPAIPTPRCPPALWVSALVCTYALQVTICASIATAGPWPLAVVRWQEDATGDVAALLAIGLLQAYALLGLYRSGARTPLVVGAALAMAAMSFAPVVTNADLYAYAGNGLLGRFAYTPPSVPFAGDLAAINVWWHAPMPPTTYGPLWLAVARTVTEPFTTLAMKLVALRTLGAASLAGLVLLLRAYGVPARILAIVALNPALYFEFVLNAHNDALPTCIAVAAAIVAPALPWLAALLIATAALVKAPYALAGLPVLAGVRSPVTSVAATALAVASALAASWFAGGAPYLHALSLHATSSGLENGLHVAAGLAAAGTVVAALAGRRRLRGAVWLFPMLGAYTAPWYALWSVPYALGARRVLTYLALTFPFVAMLAEPSLTRLWTLGIVLPAAVVLSLRRFEGSAQPLQSGPS